MIMAASFLVLLAVAALFPIYWMAIGSVQSLGNIVRVPPRFIPQDITLDNFRDLIGFKALGRPIANTLFIVVVKATLGVTVTIMAGFALACYDFPGKKVVIWILIVNVMISLNSLIIPMFVIMHRLRLLNTSWAVILPLLFTPFNVLVSRRFISEVPSAMFDHARLEGAGEAGILFRIVAPICKPFIGFVLLQTSLGVVIDFLWPSLVLYREKAHTLIVSIMWSLETLTTGFGSNDMGLSMAGGMILFVPVFIIFCFFQRYFVSGLATGSLKG